MQQIDFAIYKHFAVWILKFVCTVECKGKFGKAEL